MRSFKAFLKRNRGFIAFMLCMFMFRSAVADWNVVPSGSMLPTIRIGDRILVNRAVYDLRVPFTHYSLIHMADPQRGDIVIVDSSAVDERLVKRVIGLPGDVVALRDNELWINGQRARYRPAAVAGVAADQDDPASYASEELGRLHHRIRLSRWPSRAANYGPVAVPTGRYLLMGDNRDNSLDSRYFGFVPRDEIVGRARYVVISLDPARHYLPRSDRFGAPLD